MLFSQAEITEAQPNNGSTTGLRAPNGTSAHTSFRGHIIILASELTNVPSGVTITKLGFSYSVGTDGLADGNLKMYMENSTDASNLKSTDWVTAISTMTNVSDASYTIPISTGPVDTDIPNSTPFVYTGGAIYVAYEYIASNTAVGSAIYFADNTQAGGVKMIGSTSTTPGATLTGSSTFRPTIRLTYTNPNTNEIQVTALNFPNGKVNRLGGSSHNMQATIHNASQGTLTNVPVTLTLTGVNPYTSTQSVSSIAAGTSAIVTFSAVPAANSGMDTARITVPNDDNNSNNLLERLAYVSCDTLGACSPGGPVGSVGFNTGTGILANRYKINSTVPVVAKKVAFYIANNAASSGNIVKGILCDSNGVIVDSTFIYVITAPNLGTKAELSFINGNIDISNKDYYFGIRQSANATTGYFPFGTQPNDEVPVNRFYSLNTNGGDTASYTTLGMFLIEGVLKGRQILSSNAPGGSVCENTAVSFTTTAGYTSYDFLVDNASTQSGASNSFTHTTVGTQTYQVTSTHNGCPIPSNVLTITSSPEINNSITATICEGDIYQVGSSVYSATGNYLDTLSSSAGCDSIVSLALTVQSINPAISQNGPLLTVSQTGAGYQWINCADNQPISGATSSSYTATVNGSYACVITIGNCSDTTECRVVDFTGIGELALLKNSVISPNPTTGNIFVTWNNVNVLRIIVRDIQGKEMKVIESGLADDATTLDLSDYQSGTYLIELQTSHSKYTHLVIKK